MGFQRGKYIFLILFVSLFIITGCNKESAEQADGEGENNGDDVTITIAHPFGEEIFKDRYESIEGLPDNIKLDWVTWDETREGLEELFAKGIKPDIFNSGSVELLEEYDAIVPIDDLIDKYDFDTSVIQPSLVAFLESFDDDQKMIGVPDGGSYYALYFNKEIFDLFGVPYPDLDEPMTWSEALELAKQLTAAQNGTDYIGLEFHNNDMSAPLNQFGVNLTDPDSGEVLVAEKPEIQQYFEMIQAYYNIPGMKSEEIAESCVFCEGRAAMSIAWHGLFIGGWGDDPSVADQIDISPLPVWPKHPDAGPYLSSYPIMVSKLSEHKEEAFQVLMGYMSEENQLAMSKAATAGPATIYPSVQENFAADNEFYDDKNVPAIFALEPAIGEKRQSPKWDDHVEIGEALDKIATGNIDIQTLLRELKDESEISIKEAKEEEK